MSNKIVVSQDKIVRTLRCKNVNVPGTLGRLTSIIGKNGAEIGNITTVHMGHHYTVRDVDVLVDDYEHSLFVPHICLLCDSPDCVDACPMGALTQDIQTKVIEVNRELCNGCQACIEACSYGAIRWSERFDMILVCDRCGNDPTCVQFCTSGALVLVAAR